MVVLRWIVLVAVVVLFLASCTSGQSDSQSSSAPEGLFTKTEESWNFDEDSPGNPPKGAVVFSGTWEVRPESDAPTEPNALCQTGEAEFPATALSDKEYTDLALTTDFKPISGQEDQAAGLIFRVQDESNYYIVRANALEGNVGIYKYKDGRRTELQSESTDVEQGKWQELRVEVTGDKIRALLGKKEVVEATDDEFTSGRVGLWTKADSLTCFDDVSVET
jgi:hypothetical protein